MLARFDWFLVLSLVFESSVDVINASAVTSFVGGFPDRVSPPAEFLSFYGLLNFYLYTLAFVYSPSRSALYGECVCVCVCVSLCVCVCVCGHVYVVYEDTNLYNDMGMT